MIRSIPVLVLLGGVLGACSSLPTSGPTIAVMESARTSSAGTLFNSPTGVSVAFVDVDANIAKLAHRNTGAESFSGRFTDNRPAPAVYVGPGDTLGVTIFESSAGGLFSPPTNSFSLAGSNFVTLPPQIVSRDGMITIPYAGAVRAAGRTISDIQAEIVSKLSRRAIEPQVVITQAQNKSNLVSVGGEVNTPNRVSLTPNGDRLLDVLTMAGGSKWPAHETYITLQRGGSRASVSLQRLVANPQENIFVRPGDTVIAVRQQRHYLAFGASGRNGQFPFELDTLTVAEGMAKAGGLLDERADPAMVFLYRQEDRKLVERFGIDVNGYPHSTLPVLYRFDLRDPVGIVLAKSFPMIDKDTIFIANAASTDFLKAVAVVRGVTAVARDIDAIARGNSASTN